MSNHVFAVIEGRNVFRDNGSGGWTNETVSELVDTYDTEAEAEEAMAAIMRTWDHDTNTVTRTRRGLDTIEYNDVRVERWDLDEESDDMEIEDIDGADSITDELHRAMWRAQASYSAYLDYHADEYYGVEYYLASQALRNPENDKR